MAREKEIILSEIVFVWCRVFFFLLFYLFLILLERQIQNRKFRKLIFPIFFQYIKFKEIIFVYYIIYHITIVPFLYFSPLSLSLSLIFLLFCKLYYNFYLRFKVIVTLKFDFFFLRRHEKRRKSCFY